MPSPFALRLAQVQTPATESSVVSNSPLDNSMIRAPSVNKYSGEKIIPFDDCKTVRDARQSRVARILDASPSVHGERSDTSTDSPTQLALRLPNQVPIGDRNAWY